MTLRPSTSWPTPSGCSPRSPPRARRRRRIVELTVENGPAVGAEVLRALDAAQIAVAGLALREPSLDDVFLSLTGHKTEAETRPGARRRAEPAIGDAPRTRRRTDGKDAA